MRIVSIILLVVVGFLALLFVSDDEKAPIENALNSSESNKTDDLLKAIKKKNSELTKKVKSLTAELTSLKPPKAEEEEEEEEEEEQGGAA